MLKIKGFVLYFMFKRECMRKKQKKLMWYEDIFISTISNDTNQP